MILKRLVDREYFDALAIQRKAFENENSPAETGHSQLRADH